MQKREKILVAVTLISALIFVVNQFFFSAAEEAKPQPVKTATAAPKRVQPVKIENISNAELKRRLRSGQPLVHYDTWGKDPFEGGLVLSHGDSSADSSSTKLSGIVWQGNEAFAIIGDHILRQGEQTSTLKVVKIYHDKVIARRGKELLTLHLGRDRFDGQNIPHGNN